MPLIGFSPRLVPSSKGDMLPQLYRYSLKDRTRRISLESKPRRSYASRANAGKLREVLLSLEAKLLSNCILLIT